MVVNSEDNFLSLLLKVAVASCLFWSCGEKDQEGNNWPVYRGDKGSTGYSPLAQINPGNLHKLELAWTYHSGDAREGNKSNIECNPIIVNGLMYITTPMLKLVALDPVSGKEKWVFDPFKNQDATGVNRGVTYWTDGNDDKRIFFSAGFCPPEADRLLARPDFFVSHLSTGASM